jgi:serine/threonine-protein kinase
VKVLDFGIVKAANDAADTRPAITLDHTIQGTPAYIAPEQALGSETDGRTDIYAIGCVAYWLLTGQTVFAGETPLAVIMHHVHTPPVPPSVRSELPIPAALETIVLSCLAKNPADRPQSAKELSRMLAGVDPVNAWTEEQARGWWVKHDVA